jgi:beta-lactamase superfamily II metal-dependent hydrolase
MASIKRLTLFLLVCALWVLGVSAQTQKALEIYFIDVEGGQATLFVTPTGQSMLIDTGYPGNGDRDLNRVLAAIKQAKVKKLDFLLITHYHSDHVGNAAAIAAKIPVTTFIDHGETVETTADAQALYSGYLKGRARARHTLARPGAKILLGEVEFTIVSSGGAHLSRPLVPSAKPNPLCASFTPKDPDPSENARSVGTMITFRNFRMLDLGDLTWNKEKELVCPNNLLGPVDVYLTTHHGVDQSGAPVLVHAIQPRVAIMNNGPTKGGSAEAMKAVRSAPGLEDFWQLHYAENAGDANMPSAMIANVDDSGAHAIRLSARRDGSFTVTNERTGETRRYKPRPRTQSTAPSIR